MTPARFQTIEQIFRAALEQQPDQISAFLDRACKGDEVLRRKVEALLGSRQRADRFIETSAVGLAAKIIQNGQVDSLVGQTIGHYKISESIGTGGMGEVYLATDIVAGRKAALKLLPMRFTGDAERLKRFQHEAHAVVALNHPNILTVYEIGEDHSIHYIASELIEGETLRDRLIRGPMQLSEAVDVAIQVASALAAAHHAGIVHRDIKPENIMLRPDGYVKVLDFGIAKLAESAFAEATADKAGSIGLAETSLGSILGTVRYMSPEQACPDAVGIDKRTDIWSLGVVLYEMVSGHTPFTGDTPQEVMSAILERQPPPLTRFIRQTPLELQQIIGRALHKDRKERYRDAHDLLKALKDLRHRLEVEADLVRATAAPLWLRWARSPVALVLIVLAAALALTFPFFRHRNLTTSSPPQKSIAVLPFENLSADPDNAYLAEGMQEEVLTRLANVTDLKVISRSSTQRYQNKPRNLTEIAKQLGVANILEGSVQKTADKVRVNVQLIDAQTDSHLWADTYDRKLTDTFVIESEIAREVADALRVNLTGREKQALAVKPTNNPEAYDLYLRGLSFEARSTSLWEAAGFYERAVQLDPNFALAWARLSRADADIYLDQRDTTPGRRNAAKRALENAQKLQPNSSETLLALGYYQFRVLRDYTAAKTTFDRVSKMLPASTEVPYALAQVARREGHWDQSIAYFEQALALDPRNVELLIDAALTYSMVRQFPAALRLFDRVLDVVPNEPEAMVAKASIYQAQGNLQEAARFLSGIDGQTPNWDEWVIKIIQLRLERNYGEAIRVLQARLAQFHYASEFEKGCEQETLASTQHLAGDTAGAKLTAEQARNTLELVCKNQPDNAFAWVSLAEANAVIGDRDLALKQMIRSMTVLSGVGDPMIGPTLEAYVAHIQTMLGETGRPISTFARLLQTPGFYTYGAPITPALLRLDPALDPLRADPAFQKLCEEKQPPATP